MLTLAPPTTNTIENVRFYQGTRKQSRNDIPPVQDLSHLAPQGNGLYGLQPPIMENPFTVAPPQDAIGGVMYFDNSVKDDDWASLCKILDISMHYRKYAAFIEESSDPLNDGYVVQMRIVEMMALKHLFQVVDDQREKEFPDQELTIAQALMAFMRSEEKRWGIHFGDGLRGKFGGNYDSAQEQLSFGLMVENNYQGIYRIWSRGWLVTK